MNDTEKIARVRLLVGADNSETATTLITAFLDEAKNAILNRRFPFMDSYAEVTFPSAYDSLQCRLAARYYLRNGAEGESAHNENGINRTYGSVNDEDLLCEVMQSTKIVQ